jgi:hypothetical protein
MLVVTRDSCGCQCTSRQGNARPVTAACAWLACLGRLAKQVSRNRGSCTDCRFSFAAKDFGDVPRSVLYDDAFTGLLGGVLGDALLQCFDVVGEGGGWRRVLDLLEFEFGVKEGGVEG